MNKSAKTYPWLNPLDSSTPARITSNAIGTGKKVPTTAMSTNKPRLKVSPRIKSGGNKVPAVAPKSPAKNINGTVVRKMNHRFFT